MLPFRGTILLPIIIRQVLPARACAVCKRVIAFAFKIVLLNGEDNDKTGTGQSTEQLSKIYVGVI